MTRSEHRGVWVSDKPLDENEGAVGDILLAVMLALPSLAVLDPYEWVEAGKGYREWLVPAELLNRCGIVAIEDEREEPPEWATK